MASSTPQKGYYRIVLTPATKQNICLVCGEKKLNPKDRYKVMHKGEKAEICQLIERMLEIEISEKSHSDICCRNCARKFSTCEKSLATLKENYEETQQNLLRSHGKQITKRCVQGEQPASKRVLFQEDSAASVFEDPLDMLYLGGSSTSQEELLKDEELTSLFYEKLLKSLQSEIQHLCTKASDSMLRHAGLEDTISFSFKRLAEEWREHAPLFLRFIETTTTNPGSERNIDKKGESILPAQIAAGCKLLSVFNKDMKCLKTINSVIFLKCGMKKSGFSRLQSTGDYHSYVSTIQMADALAKNWDRELEQWQEKVQLDLEVKRQLLQQIEYITDTISLFQDENSDCNVEDLKQEKQRVELDLTRHRQTMHPGYYFVGDNVDMMTKVRTITLKNQHKDHHMYQICAYENRVSGNDLDGTKPLQNAQESPFSQLIPGAEEMKKLTENFAHIVAKIWCKYISHFRPYESLLPPYISHEHMNATKRKTKRVNMGVLKKNESRNEDMVEICKFMHQYVPGHNTETEVKPVQVLSGGDYLTFERHKQAQMSVRDDETPSLRLEGLVPKMEEFHNQAELLKVIWKVLYSTKSSRDSGKLFAARNLINARNVSNNPASDYYAAATMMDKFTFAYIVAGALEQFGMESVSDVPTQNLYSGEVGNGEQMRQYLLQEATSFVKTYVDITVKPLPITGPKSNRLICYYCKKIFKSPQRCSKHEEKVHGQEKDASGTECIVAQSNTGREDNVLNYTKCALALGLLRINHNDAISLGDGKRIMLVNNYLYLLYKLNDCPKYAYGSLETVCQSKILLSERMAHRLIWNRTVNHRGETDSNHPNDLDLEHCNKMFKDEAHSFRGVFTDKTISRVSRSALASHKIMKNFDEQTHTKKASGRHTTADQTEDIYMIISKLCHEKVFKEISNRHHESFQSVTANPFDGLEMDRVRDWISNSLQKFSVKSYYT